MKTRYFSTANELTVFANENSVTVVSITFDTSSSKFVLFYTTA